MAERRLSAEEHAIWAKVTASVRAFAPAPAMAEAGAAAEQAAEPAPPPIAATKPARVRLATAVPRGRVGETLDAGWNRRLARGLVAPEMVLDLHGYRVADAHAALDRALGEAVARGVRLLLVVTGRPPREREPPVRRGAIRAAIGDWLALSGHAARIAAVRNAHQRHGGAGALYLVLRRERGGASGR